MIFEPGVSVHDFECVLQGVSCSHAFPQVLIFLLFPQQSATILKDYNSPGNGYEIDQKHILVCNPKLFMRLPCHLLYAFIPTLAKFIANKKETLNTRQGLPENVMVQVTGLTPLLMICPYKGKCRS